jgi:microcystin-dependent protein
MATIGRVSGASFLNTPRLSYITTATFDTYFFSYSTSINRSLETVGTLTAVTGATSGNCPKGRVLRENGRKLYPGANPGITTYMVGVYDAQTMLSGFIDPNAKVFQIYNTDKPNFLLDGVDPTTDSTDRGGSVYTRGDVLVGGKVDISGSTQIYGVLNVDNNITQYGYTFLPKFAVIMWAGSVASIPVGWLLCNGQTATINGMSVTAPNLSGRFILSYGQGPLNFVNTTVGATGGEQDHILTVAEMPTHSHTTNANAPSIGLAQQTGNNTRTTTDSTPGELDLDNAASLTIDSTGGSNAHNNMPPYYVLCYIMKGF